MKASINLGFTQNLALTPQLQQSIKLLQLSSLELEQELILAAENNPFLDFESEMSASSQEQAPIISEINSIKTKIEMGVDSAGFKTTQLPAPNAGASFQAAIKIGKFQGII